MPRFTWPHERQCKLCAVQLTTGNSYEGHWYCKECQKARKRSHRPPQPQSPVNHSTRRRAELAAYKIRHGCTDCGWREDWRKLEFDHIPPHVKLFEVGWAAHRPNQIDDDALWREVAKCEVVCHDCHIARTAHRASKEFTRASR